MKYDYKKELESLIKNEFPEIGSIKNIELISDAITTTAYKITGENKVLIAKVAYDEGDILDGKGRKEKEVLELVSSMNLNMAVPSVYRYFENYDNFPGYIIFLELLEGKTLDANEFAKIGVLDKNIKNLAKFMNLLHKNTFPFVTDFATFKAPSIGEYIDKYKEKYKKSFKKDEGWYKKMLPHINKLDQLKIYYEGLNEYSFSHRDINYKNIMVIGDDLSGIIDWEGAFTVPKSFDFAHVSILAPIYGLSKWHNKLTNYYANNYTEDPNVFLKEIEMVKLFTALRYFAREFSHSSSDKKRTCVETGEPLEDYYFKYVNGWTYPF